MLSGLIVGAVTIVSVGLGLEAPGPLSSAGADTVVDGCTIVSNPTATDFTDCPGADLAGADLAGVDLSYADLSDATFVSCSNTGIPSCTAATLTDADLTDSDIAAAVFEVSDSNDRPFPPVGASADLSGADLTGSDAEGAYLVGTTMTGADLARANLTDAGLFATDLTDAVLTHSNLSGAVITESTFTGTQLVPDDQTVRETSSSGAMVTWPNPVSLPGATPDGCNYPSGSIFPAGTTTVTCTVVDQEGDDATGTFVIVVQRPLTITTTSLPAATVASSYSATLTARYGNPPYTWRLVSGKGRLPAGLKLDRTTGIISGTPTKRGATSTFTVEVVDAKESSRPHSQDSAEASLTIEVSS